MTADGSKAHAAQQFSAPKRELLEESGMSDKVQAQQSPRDRFNALRDKHTYGAGSDNKPNVPPRRQGLG
jgi:hypothetical protein